MRPSASTGTTRGSRASARSDPRKAGYYRKVRAIVGLAVTLVILAIAFLIVTRSPLFRVETVYATSTSHVSAETISSLAAVPVGSTLFSIDEDAIIARVKQNPWVEQVSITRTFPHQLDIAVTERTEVAIVSVHSDAEAWRISSDGYWLEAIAMQTDASAESPLDQASKAASQDGVVIVTDTRATVSPSAGNACTDEEILAVVTYLQQLPQQLLDQIVSFKAPSIQGVSAILSNGVEISLGSPTGDIAWKGEVALQILNDNAGTVTYINVRTPDTPSWRGLDADMAADIASTDTATDTSTDTSVEAADEAVTDTTDTATDQAAVDETDVVEDVPVDETAVDAEVVDEAGTEAAIDTTQEDPAVYEAQYVEEEPIIEEMPVDEGAVW